MALTSHMAFTGYILLHSCNTLLCEQIGSPCCAGLLLGTGAWYTPLTGVSVFTSLVCNALGRAFFPSFADTKMNSALYLLDRDGLDDL